jgi:gamma-glutamyl-gamma-aminobutyrate hydrolase PuuD
MQTVFIEGGGQCYHQMFINMGFTVVPYPSEATLVCFTGGSDVNPALYGEAVHPTTHFNAQRDADCMEIYTECVDLGISMVGICRGSQFLCVANGGKLWQDIDSHTQDHKVLDYRGGVFGVTSTHHQEMRPVGGKLLLTARSGTYRSHMTQGIVKTINAVTPTVEGVCWEDTRCLSVQGHPEFYDASPEFKAWFAVHVGKLIKGRL